MRVVGTIGALWGALGLSALLGSAIWRLYPQALELGNLELGTLHWVALLASVAGLAYSEGYRGFQQAFSPRAAARTLYLRDQPDVLRTLFAPLFCMGFIHATRKRMIASYILTAVIIGLIVSVRALSQPWRGIVDAGVVVGLGWGLISYWLFLAQAFGATAFSRDPEVPTPA